MEEVGYIKYEGPSVDEGIIDAKSAGTALIGLDESIRFFNARQSSSYLNLDYEIPVHIEKGSWVAMVLAGVVTVSGAFAIGYAKKAGEKMAENDFNEIGLGDVFKKSFSAICQLIKLAKHTNKTKDWNLDKVEWKNNNREIGIYNEQGELEFIEIEFIEWYQKMPISIMSKIASPIQENRKLAIGIKIDGGFKEENLDFKQKVIFTNEILDDDFDDFIFPELQHGDKVILEGKLTRGNESSNTVGFEYQDHILNCVPDEGNIVRYKPALFLKCIVEGTVIRYSKKKVQPDKKPTIIISNVIPIEEESQNSLF